MEDSSYFMEHKEEIERLEMKTDAGSVIKQAMWAGIGPGMRVLDLGCGTGKTSSFLYRLVQPSGSVTGMDRSAERTTYANSHYRQPGLDFICRDIFDQIDGLGSFDFIWIRFFLQYFKKEGAEIVRKATSLLRPGGIICLVDQDCNSLLNYGIPLGIQTRIEAVVKELEEKYNFDPLVGRKLYSFLYDCCLEDISVVVDSHNLIYGPLPEQQRYNFRKKMEIAVEKSSVSLDDYPNGLPGFLEDFQKCFEDSRRFSYSPLVLCRGRKPG